MAHISLLIVAMFSVDPVTNALANRRDITSGRIRVHQTITVAGHAPADSREHWQFTTDKFRCDLLTHSGRDAFYRALTNHARPESEPIARQVYANGLVMSRFRVGENGYSNYVDQHGKVNMWNGRMFGLPGAPNAGETALDACYRLDRPRTVTSVNGGIYSVRINLADGGTLTMKIDSAKDWNITEYRIVRPPQSDTGAVWESRCTMELTEYGDHWFPSQVTKEVRKDGDFRYRREFVITECELNVPVEDAVFEWPALGISVGEPVFHAIRGPFSYGE